MLSRYLHIHQGYQGFFLRFSPKNSTFRLCRRRQLCRFHRFDNSV